MGNDLPQAEGSIRVMFSSDGGIIRTEQTQFIQGTNNVKSSVIKDGHTFTVHIMDPKVEGEEEEEEETTNGSEKPEYIRATPSPKLEEGQEKGELEKSEKEGMYIHVNVLNT